MKKVPFKLSNTNSNLNLTSDVVYLIVDSNDNVYCNCCNEKFEKNLRIFRQNPLPLDENLYEWNCSKCHTRYLGPLKQ